MPPGSNLMVFEMFINDTVKDMNGGAAVCSDGFKGERLKTVSVTLRVCTVCSQDYNKHGYIRWRIQVARGIVVLYVSHDEYIVKMFTVFMSIIQ